MQMVQSFRLSNEPRDLGLNCSDAGLSLAGVPLLHKSKSGFVARPLTDVAVLLGAAYGENSDPRTLHSSLGVIADALNRGNLARATMAAVLTKMPELSREAAARLMNADKLLAKFNPDEPRDWHGRWTIDGDTNSGGYSGNRATERQQTAPPVSASSTRRSSDRISSGSAEFAQRLEREYDDLGPVDFSIRVYRFGWWLERNGKNLSPAGKQRALAEYSFIQDRLSFWLSYDYKPPASQTNLIGAAYRLYVGAINGGIVQVGHFPPSIADVIATAWSLDGGAPRIRSANEQNIMAAPPEARIVPQNKIEGPGGVISTIRASIRWGKGIRDQNGDWEGVLAEENPEATRLAPTAKTFDLHNKNSGEAISAKTMNVQSYGYSKNPQRIYYRLKGYVDATANYRPRTSLDINPDLIRSRTIQLAIPEYVAPKQWRYLYRAIRYGRERDVRLVITRISD